jgi:tetratricopeptide (TPR) repeat protein
VETAAKHYRTALVLRRETQYRNGEAETLLALGRLTEDREYLEKAVALGREIDRPGVFALGLAYLALHAGGDVDEALRVFEQFESRLRHQDKLEARMTLFKVTGDRAHLEAAHALLEHGRKHAPEEFRDSMVENVPLNREIMEAFEL